MRTAMFCLVVLAAGTQAQRDLKSEIVKQASELSIEDHADLIEELRTELEKRILVPSKRLRARLPAGRDSGVNRILNRGAFEGKTNVRGGGAYFSFTTYSNDYNREPDLELQQWKLCSGFAGGDFGLVQAIPVERVEDVTLAEVPDLFRMPPGQFYAKGRKEQIQRRNAAPGLPPGGLPPSLRPDAAVGTVYAMRSIRWRESDLIAAFEVLEKDRFGVTFAWRVLERRPNPGDRR